LQALLVETGVDEQANRTILNPKLNHQALRHGISAGNIRCDFGGFEDQTSGGKIDGDVSQVEQVHPDDGIRFSGKLGVADQITDKHDHVGCTNRTELNFRPSGCFPLEILIKIETLRGMRVQLQLFGNSFPDHAGTRIQDKFQMFLVSEAPLDLNEGPRDEPERQHSTGRVFRRPGLIVWLQSRG
jgi:hypothetical protein